MEQSISETGTSGKRQAGLFAHAQLSLWVVLPGTTYPHTEPEKIFLYHYDNGRFIGLWRYTQLTIHGSQELDFNTIFKKTS